MKYFWCILLLLTFSCQGSEEKFKQPEVLNTNAKFDLTILTFNEDIQKLVSKTLDSVNVEFTNEDFSYPVPRQLSQPKDSKEFLWPVDKRYYYKTVNLDSMAQFFGLYASMVEIETDTNYKMRVCVAKAKVFDKKDLDAALHKMYGAYGMTNSMKSSKSERGLQEVTYVHTDENGEVTHEIKHQEYDVDYESYLYQYDGNIDYFEQWNLPDRMIQINISEGIESIIKSGTNNYENNSYYQIEFLVIAKGEFDQLKRRLIAASTESNYPMRYVKPYYIHELDFYSNFSKYYVGETSDGVKTYDFNK